MSILQRNLKTGFDGFKKLVNDLETTTPEKRDKILAAIENEDPFWRHKIEESLLTFPEMFDADESSIQQVLDEMTEKEMKWLAISVRDHEELLGKALANMTAESGREMKMMFPDLPENLTEGQVKSARMSFIGWARKIESEKCLKLKTYDYDHNAPISKSSANVEAEKEEAAVFGRPQQEEGTEKEYMKMPFISADETMRSIPMRLIGRVKHFHIIFDIMSFGPGGMMIKSESALAENIAKTDAFMAVLEPRGDNKEQIEVKCNICEKRTKTNPKNGNTNYLYKLEYHDVQPKNTQIQLDKLFQLIYKERPQIG